MAAEQHLPPLRSQRLEDPGESWLRWAATTDRPAWRALPDQRLQFQSHAGHEPGRRVAVGQRRGEAVGGGGRCARLAAYAHATIRIVVPARTQEPSGAHRVVRPR